MDGNAYVRAVERLYLHLAEDGFRNKNDTDAHRTGGSDDARGMDSRLLRRP